MKRRAWAMTALALSPASVGSAGVVLAQVATPDGMPWWASLILGPLGVLGMFIVIVYTGRRGDWVWGREYKENMARLERLLDTAQANNQKVIDHTLAELARRPATGAGG